MAKKKGNYVKLKCEQCKSVNYIVSKSHNATVDGVKLELNKYCPKCKKHTPHKESKR